MFTGPSLCRRCAPLPLQFLRGLHTSQPTTWPPFAIPSVRKRRALHGTRTLYRPRKRDFFSTNSALRDQQASRKDAPSPLESPQKKRQSGKTSLRRVAVEAQRSRDGLHSDRSTLIDPESKAKKVKAYCVAEQFNVSVAMQKLRDQGYAVDPFNTGLFPQVVHAQTPVSQNLGNDGAPGSGRGDVFIFPSGTVVAWSVPEDTTFRLVTETLLAAATNAHVSQLETEDMEYLEDPKKENSTIRGDTIVVGTRRSGSGKDEGASTSEPSRNIAPAGADNADRNHTPPLGDVDTVFAKIAFSSGLARSTKLAVLESLLNDYFESTRSIPTMLSQGSRLPYTRSFILRKTGQLLSVRAQLNLYSELTDSLPDLFWDSRHDLGLEGYYDQVGRALDVGVRIKTLNEKMDYAQEIASVLRERLSEKHGLTLEWMIIALITIEVAFEILRLYKERRENSVETETSS